MDFADRADAAKSRGDLDESRELLQRAFYYESLAALEFIDVKAEQPTRSVLFRSAASLALECGLYDESELMVELGLAGVPPAEVADELRNIRKQLEEKRPAEVSGGTPKSWKSEFTKMQFWQQEAHSSSKQGGANVKLLMVEVDGELKPFLIYQDLDSNGEQTFAIAMSEAS